jgi:hypothetical protein
MRSRRLRRSSGCERDNNVGGRRAPRQRLDRLREAWRSLSSTRDKRTTRSDQIGAAPGASPISRLCLRTGARARARRRGGAAASRLTVLVCLPVCVGKRPTDADPAAACMPPPRPLTSRPRKTPIGHRVQRRADDVPIPRHQTLEVLGQPRGAQLEPHEKGRGTAHPRSLTHACTASGRSRPGNAGLEVEHAALRRRRDRKPHNCRLPSGKGTSARLPRRLVV